MTEVNLHTYVKMDDKNWNTISQNLTEMCQVAVRAAWAMGYQALPYDHQLRQIEKRTVEISVLLTSSTVLKRLNSDYRNKNTPTNVLSFPGDYAAPATNSEVLLGDVILGREKVIQEAEDMDKDISDHATHLVVHGVLHLLGYDHENDNEAIIMESLEVNALASLGLSNPYETNR